MKKSYTLPLRDNPAQKKTLNKIREVRRLMQKDYRKMMYFFAMTFIVVIVITFLERTNSIRWDCLNFSMMLVLIIAKLRFFGRMSDYYSEIARLNKLLKRQRSRTRSYVVGGSFTNLDGVIYGGVTHCKVAYNA